MFSLTRFHFALVSLTLLCLLACDLSSITQLVAPAPTKGPEQSLLQRVGALVRHDETPRYHFDQHRAFLRHHPTTANSHS